MTSVKPGDPNFIGPVVPSPRLDGQAFEVDTETLDAAAKTLDNLVEFARYKMLVDLEGGLNLGPGGGGKADTVFGTFDASKKAAEKHHNHYQAAFSTTNQLIKSLEDLAELTRRFAQNYRNAEEASKAGIDDVNRILQGGGPISSPSPTQGPSTTSASYRPASGQQGGF